MKDEHKTREQLVRELGAMRRRVEELQRQSEEDFRLLFEKSADPVVLIDGTTVIDANEVALKLMGLEGKDRLTGFHLTDMSPERQPDGRLSSEKSKELNAATIAKGVSHFEWMARTLDGEELLLDVSQTVIPFRGRQIKYTVWRDIRDRKRSEEALKESEERYRRVVQLSPAGIFIHVDGKFEFANHAFAKLAGATAPEQLYGRSIFDFVHPDFVGRAADRIKTAISEGPPLPAVEHGLLRPDGSLMDVQATTFPFRYKDHDAMMVVMEDITQRKQAEEGLKKKERDLEKKSLDLEEANTALRVVIRHGDEDKAAIENAILVNVKELIVPYIDKLRNTHLDAHQGAYLAVIETELNGIISPFLQKMAAIYARFTPSERQIADLIKSGKTSKQIADLLNISTGTVDTHRNNIRKKLGLRYENSSLQAYLLSL